VALLGKKRETGARSAARWGGEGPARRALLGKAEAWKIEVKLDLVIP
jgi:hypothetical protein